MGCNCGRKRLQVTSANIAETAGAPTVGARDAARAREQAQAMVAAARETMGTADPNQGNGE
ncbi:MAG TPA: hypothetical protein VFP47_14305 [Pyrinomonadaceae bacterium]|nr:hypothetical protein [Pyrinomonadaceae bacterium]